MFFFYKIYKIIELLNEKDFYLTFSVRLFQKLSIQLRYIQEQAHKLTYSDICRNNHIYLYLDTHAQTSHGIGEVKPQEHMVARTNIEVFL